MYKNLKIILFSVLSLICLISLTSCGSNWDAYKVKVVEPDNPITIDITDNGRVVYQGDAIDVFIYCVNDVVSHNDVQHKCECVKLVQYENFFKVYTEEKVFTFSNSLYGYCLESNV